jgi:hypothetical protein
MSNVFCANFSFIGLGVYMHWLIFSKQNQENRKERWLKTVITMLTITVQIIFFIGLQGAPSNIPSDPKGLQLVLEYLKGTYGNLPIYIQENGKHNFPPEASMFKRINLFILSCVLFHIWSGMGSADGSLDDTDRIAYLSSYMENTLHALRCVKIKHIKKKSAILLKTILQ